MLSELPGNILSIYLDAAPWLLLGLLAAGLIKAWVPEGLINRWLGGKGLWPITKAALIGAPLPLCSCGVLPAALGLRRAGASRGSTISFLIATPETGADSIAVSYALLGPFMTLVRPIAAILSAIFAGLLATLPKEPPKPRNPFAFKVDSTASCAGNSCGCGPTEPATKPGFLHKSRDGIRYALTDILDDIVWWLLLGIVLAGLITTLVPPNTLASWGSGIGAMLLMLIIGVPMYICATASTPLAAALLLAGISPGTVLVFLLAGPATNIATLGVVRKEMGGKVLAAYLIGISVASIGLGLITDGLVSYLNIDISAQLGEAGEFLPDAIVWGSAVILVMAALSTKLKKH